MAGSEIGRRLRQFRNARGWSLQLVADRAGISKSHLSNLEAGRRTLDSRTLVADLATALEVAPTDLTGVPQEIPREPADDRALIEVRHALLAVSMDEPLGEVQPAERLRTRVNELLEAQNNADSATVGAKLPALIRDLHATLAAHRDERDVLRLLALAHMQGTQAWLAAIGAPIDLSWQAATLARNAGEELNEPTSLAIGAYGTALGLLAAGSFGIASRTLADAQLTPTTPEDTQLAGSLALASSLVSAARKDQAERSAALDAFSMFKSSRRTLRPPHCPSPGPAVHRSARRRPRGRRRGCRRVVRRCPWTNARPVFEVGLSFLCTEPSHSSLAGGRPPAPAVG